MFRRELLGLGQSHRGLIHRGDVVPAASEKDRVAAFALGEAEHRTGRNPVRDPRDELVWRRPVNVILGRVTIVPEGGVHGR